MLLTIELQRVRLFQTLLLKLEYLSQSRLRRSFQKVQFVSMSKKTVTNFNRSYQKTSMTANEDG